MALSANNTLYDGTTGSAGGDLSGTYPNPMVLSISNVTTGTLGATHGGTGQASYAKGDILISSASNTLSKLTIGSTGAFLTVVSGAPAWV